MSKNSQHSSAASDTNRQCEWPEIASAWDCGVGWWARKWQQRPDQLVWACALALALRCYTESVMDGYYIWPAHALGVAVAACRGPVRFPLAIVVAGQPQAPTPILSTRRDHR